MQNIFSQCRHGIVMPSCRIFLGQWEPTSLRRRQNDHSTLKFDQKHHVYATILARRRQTLKSGELRSPDPGVSTGMVMPHGVVTITLTKLIE